jgi:hypothetical protein
MEKQVAMIPPAAEGTPCGARIRNENPEPPMKTKTFLKTARDHLWGPAGSVLFHGLLVALLLAWSRHPRDANTIVDSPVVEARPSDPPVTLDPPLTPPENKWQPDAKEKFDPREIATAMPDAMDGGDPIAETTPDTGDKIGGPMDIDAPKSVLMIDLPAEHLPGLLGDRLRQIQETIGTKRSLSSLPTSIRMGPANSPETHIIRALGWLKAHQNEDGSWGPNQIAMTGLALLTFLGHGDTTQSKEYGATVRKAIDFLADHQQDDGLFSRSKQIAQTTVYEHAIATYAISEAYGMTRRPDLKDLMEKAAAIIVRGQQPGGLWNYEYKKETRWDTSVTGWQIQALKAAHINGAEVTGIADAIAKSAEGLRQAQASDSGRFGYTQTGQGNISMTGIGALCLELTGHVQEKPTRAGLFALRDADCDWQKPVPWPLYTWYYVTQALYHDQGAVWDSWNRKLFREFSRNQNEDGSWASPSGSAYENEETKHGPVYSTTLAVLSLEAPYRYAPVSHAMHELKQHAPQKNKDDVIVEII